MALPACRRALACQTAHKRRCVVMPSTRCFGMCPCTYTSHWPRIFAHCVCLPHPSLTVIFATMWCTLACVCPTNSSQHHMSPSPHTTCHRGDADTPFPSHPDSLARSLVPPCPHPHYHSRWGVYVPVHSDHHLTSMRKQNACMYVCTCYLTYYCPCLMVGEMPIHRSGVCLNLLQ